MNLDEQTFEDFKSKYLDIYDRSHNKEPGASILDELDFELELIHRDEVNVAYILKLLGDIQKQYYREGRSDADSQKAIQGVLELLGNEVQLRSKRELIEKFMLDYMPSISPDQDLQDVFTGYWYKEKRQKIHALCEVEGLDKDAVYRMMDEYNFTGKDPLREQIFDALDYQPKLLERKAIYSRILKEFKDIIQRFEDDTGNLGLGENLAEFSVVPLIELAHSVGDELLYFTDEIKYSRLAQELLRFTVTLDKPYVQELATLSTYNSSSDPSGSDLISRGVISDDILDDYLWLIGKLGDVCEEYGLVFASPGAAAQEGLIWTLSEARSGSTILEFSLSVLVVTCGSIMAFLSAYPKAADGWERFKRDLKDSVVPVDSTESGTAPVTKLIIDDQVTDEMRLYREERDR